MDSWKRPYRYQYPGNRSQGGFDVWSVGPKDDETEQIGNWQKR